MDKLVVYIKVICLVSVFAGVISALIPKGGLKGAYLSLSAVVLLTATLAPLKSFSEKDFADFTFKHREASESLSAEMQTAEVMLYSRMISDAIEKRLKQQGITADVSTQSRRENEDIFVTKMTLKGTFTESQREETASFLKSAFEKAEIIFEEEENG